MPREVILLLFGVLLLVGGYLVWDTYGDDAAMALRAAGFIAPEDKKPESGAVVAKAEPVSPLAARLGDSLIKMDNGTPLGLSSKQLAQLAKVKYWAFYYSASWCPPCRTFTPELVEFYNEFKPSHPDFELIFVDSSEDENALLSYMRNDSMPWPAISHADLDNPSVQAERYHGSRSIPYLVLVGPDGSVLSDNVSWFHYRNPREVMADIRTMVK